MNLSYKDKIFKQELFHGIKKKNNYFEGWYFKLVTEDLKYSISFIVGVSKTKEKESSFIQIIDNIKNRSYYINYKLEDFTYSNDPFSIKIKDNYFSFDSIKVDIDEPIKIKIDISYSDLTKINKSIYAPNIMGPFAYLTFMECNHAVISLRHKLNGYAEIYNRKISFNNGKGYIEKDYGTSFPNKYIWLEANSLNKSSIFLAIANIPILKTSFTGIIGIIEVNKKQYRFSTYDMAKLKKLKKKKDTYYIEIKQRNKLLKIELTCSKSMKLISPKNGNMKDTVHESLSSNTKVTLYEKNKIIFNETFKATASEIFNF